MILYLMIVVSIYCLALSSDRGTIFFAPFMLVIGAYRVPNSEFVNVYLVPFIGVRWRL